MRSMKHFWCVIFTDFHHSTIDQSIIGDINLNQKPSGSMGIFFNSEPSGFKFKTNDNHHKDIATTWDCNVL